MKMYFFREIGSIYALVGWSEDVNKAFLNFKKSVPRDCYKVAVIDKDTSSDLMPILNKHRIKHDSSFIEMTDAEILNMVVKHAPQIGQVLNEVLESGIKFRDIINAVKKQTNSTALNPNKYRILEYTNKVLKGSFTSKELLTYLEGIGIKTNRLELARVLNESGKHSFVKFCHDRKKNVRVYNF